MNIATRLSITFVVVVLASIVGHQVAARIVTPCTQATPQGSDVASSQLPPVFKSGAKLYAYGGMGREYFEILDVRGVWIYCRWIDSDRGEHLTWILPNSGTWYRWAPEKESN